MNPGGKRWKPELTPPIPTLLTEGIVVYSRSEHDNIALRIFEISFGSSGFKKGVWILDAIDVGTRLKYRFSLTRTQVKLLLKNKHVEARIIDIFSKRYQDIKLTFVK